MARMSLESNERTSQIPAPVHTLMKKLKLLEEDRKKSFKHWQYKDTEKCSVKKMAEAGFFYTGTSDDDDSAACFVCGKLLDGWENEDEPWKEHEKHAPNCHFVKMHLIEDDLTVEQFLDLGANIIKGYATQIFNQKLAAVVKRADEISNSMKSQMF